MSIVDLAKAPCGHLCMAGALPADAQLDVAVDRQSLAAPAAQSLAAPVTQPLAAPAARPVAGVGLRRGVGGTSLLIAVSAAAAGLAHAADPQVGNQASSSVPEV